jgi:uncharacterized protein YjeT (DUF2065 family)
MLLLDCLLILGAVIGALGILKILAQLNDRSFPMVGIVTTAIGAGLLYWVQMESGQDLTLTEFPDAIFRVIGQMN